MDFIFLGTSAGTPTKQRNVTAFALLEEVGRSWHLVDCGEATQHQILRTKLSLNQLTTIFITHIHGDHCYGLPGVLASAGMTGREAPLVIVAPEGIEAWLRATMQHTRLFLPYEIQFISTESFGEWRAGNYRVSATSLSHRVPSFAYGFTEERMESRLNQQKLTADGIPRGPLWGDIKKGGDVEFGGRVLRSADYLLFDYLPRKIVVSGDNDRPELLAETCENCNILVHEATYTADIARKAGDGFGHSSAEQIARFAESLRIPNLILTHFSPRYQFNTTKSPSIAEIRDEAALHYRGNLSLAEDFAHYRLTKAGELHLE